MFDAQKLKNKAQQRGFTLVEIAIVLVIIALIMTAVLKAKGVMDKAKSNELNQMMQELDVAVDLYKDKMGVYPSSENSTGVSDGNATAFFQDLYEEEFITSTNNEHAFEGTVIPYYDAWNSTVDGSHDTAKYGVNATWTGNFPNPVSFLRFTEVPPGYARLADELYDDENATAGMIRATHLYNSTEDFITVFYNLDG